MCNFHLVGFLFALPRDQVCALFNARANVGEARFVCPLCRLRTVVTKSTILGAAATAAEVRALAAEKGVGHFSRREYSLYLCIYPRVLRCVVLLCPPFGARSSKWLIVCVGLRYTTKSAAVNYNPLGAVASLGLAG